MNKIWFFGDSYLQYEENWVSELAYRCNCRVANLGIGGSSVSFLMFDLLKKIEKIQPNDRVVIGITSPVRFMFNGKHYHSLHEDYGVEYLKEKADIYSNEEIEAVIQYFNHLFKIMEKLRESKALATYIVNELFAKIKTPYKQYFYTIFSNDYLMKEDIHKHNYGPAYRKEIDTPGMLQYSKRFMYSTGLLNEGATVQDELDFLSTHNHWIDHPDYEKYFWDKYDLPFKHMYA